MDTAAANHRAALASAQQVVLVAAAPTWSGCGTPAPRWTSSSVSWASQRQAINLLLNRHDARFHHDPCRSGMAPWRAGGVRRALRPCRRRSARSPSNVRWSSIRPAAPVAACSQFAERLNEGGPVRLPAAADQRTSRAGWWRALAAAPGSANCAAARFRPPSRAPVLRCRPASEARRGERRSTSSRLAVRCSCWPATALRSA